MFSKHTVARVALLALVIMTVLALPMAAGAQVANGITSPAADATVKGLVEVKGNVGGPNFSKWQLDLLPGGDPNAAIFLALGSNSGPVVYALDTTKLPDGTHALRLRSVRADSNYDEYVTKFTIANAAAAKPAAAATQAPAAAATVAAKPTAPVTATVAAKPAAPITATVAAATAAPAAATPAPAAAPVFGLTSPKAKATVSGKVDVVGNAGGPNFLKWQLDLLPGANPNAAVFLALGFQPGPITYTLDSTAWPNGAHALRLRNVRTDSNYDEVMVPFTITNQAKTAPVAAAPTIAASTTVTNTATPAPAR